MGGRCQKKTGTQVMKTLVTAIQKGGQGKTFATCHLAFDFQERGLRVAVIDLDTQGNASYTLADHDSGIAASELFNGHDLRGRFAQAFEGGNGLVLIAADSGLANLDKMELSQAGGALRTSVAALGEFFDVCLIDTAPSLGVGMTAAVLAADYMLSPVEMEAYSLQGMKKMVAVIGNLRKMNPKLRFLGMVPNKVDARKPRHIANLSTLQKAYPQLVLPFSVGYRDSIAVALGEQMPVWKIKKTAARKATKEVRALADYVFTKMEIVR
jgi:chromosome partitioning protein